MLQMDAANKTLWNKVLGEIETEVSKGQFLTLFKPTALLSLEKGVASIAVPSPMIIDLLQKRFYQSIKKTVDKHTGVDTKIVFVPKILVADQVDSDPGPLFAAVEKPGKTLTVGHLPRVRPDYTFATLAVSSTNQLAYVSATTVAEKIGRSYNPLFIYGPVGVGKTHLMQAIANAVYAKTPDKKIIYTTSEEFTNEVVEAIRTNDTSRMKKKFRSIDLLIIDDVQFFAGKEKVQEELFHTFNILIDREAQLVLSSDRPPSEIKNLEKRLSSRFSGGLMVDVSAPDFELRTAILLIKAKKYGALLSMELAKKIAEKAQDARALEGSLLKVITLAQTKGVEITEDLIHLALPHDKEQNGFLHPDQVIDTICSFYTIKPTQIRGEKRDARLVRARQVAMYVLKNNLSLTLSQIGDMLGGRDHTTIMHGVEKVGKLLLTKEFSQEFLGITSFLKKQVVE